MEWSSIKSASFDYDFADEFEDFNISIDLGFSNADSRSTHLYNWHGQGFSRSNYQGDLEVFRLTNELQLLSNKYKTLQEGEIAVVRDINGDVHAVQIVDSQSRIHGDEVSGVQVIYKSLMNELVSENVTFSITDLREAGNTEEGGVAKWQINRTGNLKGTSHVRFNTYEEKGLTLAGHPVDRADAGSDYVAKDEILTFSPGETYKIVEVQTIDDNEHEPNNESFKGRISTVNAGDRINGYDYDAVWIVDNDEDVTQSEPDAGNNVEVIGDNNNMIISVNNNMIINSIDNSVTNAIDNSVTTIDNSVTIVNNVDNSVTSLNDSTTINSTINNTDNSFNETISNIDNSINTADNSTNVNIESITNIYNAFTMEKVPVDLSEIIRGSGKGSELVAGSNKDDIIGFGRGRHRLFGDTGEDVFVFNKRDKFGNKGADRIIDFNPAKDQLLVGNKALKGIGGNPEFATASNRKEMNDLKQEDMELVYFEPKGQMYYNQNDEGKGFGKKGGLFAILDGSPELTEESIGLMG